MNGLIGACRGIAKLLAEESSAEVRGELLVALQGLLTDVQSTAEEREAENTSVSVEKSRAEIESILSRYGAAQFAYASDSLRGLAMVSFTANDRQVRFVLKLPLQSEKQFRFTPGRHVQRSDKAVYEAWEQACRQRWRALALAIKAKLEAVAIGITEFEDEFLAHIVLPNGNTVGNFIRPQIAKSYLTHEMPSCLPGIAYDPKQKGGGCE